MPVLQPSDQRSGRGRRDDHRRHRPRSASNSCVPPTRAGTNVRRWRNPPQPSEGLSITLGPVSTTSAADPPGRQLFHVPPFRFACS